MMNLAARELLFKDPEIPYHQYTIEDLELENQSGITDQVIYRKLFGPGKLIRVSRGKGNVFLFKRELTTRRRA